MIAPSDFRAIFPEFQDTAKYTDTQVTFWITQAYEQLDNSALGSQLDFAVMLFTAHNLALSQKAAMAAQLGAAPGATSGVATSKSVGGASISYDPNLTATAGAGFWNATIYGQRLWTLMQSFALGPRYVRGRTGPGVLPLPYGGYRS